MNHIRILITLWLATLMVNVEAHAERSLKIVPGPPASPGARPLRLQYQPQTPSVLPPVGEASSPSRYSVIAIAADTPYLADTEPVKISAGGAVLFVTKGQASLPMVSAFTLYSNPTVPKGFRWVNGSVGVLRDGSNIVPTPFKASLYGNSIYDVAPYIYPWVYTRLEGIDDAGNVYGNIETRELDGCPIWWSADSTWPEQMANRPDARGLTYISKTDTSLGYSGTEVSCVTAGGLTFGQFITGSVRQWGKVIFPGSSGYAYWASPGSAPVLGEDRPPVVAVSPSGNHLVYRYPAGYGVDGGEPGPDPIYAISNSGRYLLTNKPGMWGEASKVHTLSSVAGTEALAINSANDILARRGAVYFIMKWDGEAYQEREIRIEDSWQIKMLGKGLSDQGLVAGKFVRVKDEQGLAIPLSEQRETLGVLVKCGLGVDADRDGLIGFEEGQTPETALAFWSNDDVDRRHMFYDANPDTMSDESEWEEDDIGPDEASQKGWQEDWKDNIVNSLRDLEDFNRIVLSVGGLDEAFKDGTLYLGLKWSNTSGTSPAIKLYRQYKISGDLGYLSSDYDGRMQMPEPAIVDAKYPSGNPTTSTRTKIDGTETFVLPATLWNGLPAGSIKRPFLFEVCTPGKGQLKLVILKQENGAYTEICDGPGVWFDFKQVGDMYEQWSVGHGNGGPPDTVAGRLPALTGSGTTFCYDNPTPSPEENKYVLFVHGWNMERWEKERFAETAYKRLWWQGYKGRFGVFTWPATFGFSSSQSDLAWVRFLSSGAMGMANGTHFDRGEWTAWRSAVPLRRLLQTLAGAYNGEVYVFSHSMGGIVVSEALRLQSQAGGGQIVKTYVPSQAALPAHTYDATLSTAAGSSNALQWTYNHPSLPNGNANYGPQTPNVYEGWHGSMLSGSGESSKAVGRIMNFFNRNDWALSAPIWQFNQLTKPDWPDPNNGQPHIYAHQGGPDVALSDAHFGRRLDPSVPDYLFHLDLGTSAEVRDRYEIMAFAAESRVKALGATSDVREGPISDGIDLQSIWGADPRAQNHRTHRWHSGQFRNYIQYQRTYWKALLSDMGFDIQTVTLP